MGCGASANSSEPPPPGVEEEGTEISVGPKPKISFKQSAKLIGKLQTLRTKRRRKSSTATFALNVNVITKVKEKLRNIRQRFKAPPTPLILGDIDAEVTSSAKIVRVFTSSTFKDSVEERNILIEEAYPELKSFCQARGYDFQVVDMRWGVRDEASDDHSTTDLCLKEIDLCQKLSTGPNFVSFVSHRYGAPQLPRHIEADEFEKMINNIGEEGSDGKDLLTRWYRRDENIVPVTYILSPISRQIPDILGKNGEEPTKGAKQRWLSEKSDMLEMLQDLAQKYLTPSECEKYTVSVTEKETAVGMIDVPAPGKHCLWFRRNITDIEDQPPSEFLERYMECKGPDTKWKAARESLRKLKDEKMSQVLPPQNLFTYDIKWTETGVDKNNPDHWRYLNTLTSDLVTRMKEMILEGITNQPRASRDVMLVECSQHLSFARKRCDIFFGREEILDNVRDFFSNKSRRLLVIHGKSGSGKASIAAMTVKHARSWMSSKGAAIVVRFLGTTATSSTILSLLQSVVKQVKLIYRQNPTVSQNPKSLVKEFENCLKLAKAERPLVVILDSLNQLDTENSGHKLEWLTRVIQTLPHVKIVFTTLDEDPNGTLSRLQDKYPGSENYINILELPVKDTEGIVQQYLNQRNRKLTAAQMAYFLSYMKSCSIPLYLKLSFDEACKWHSYTPSDETVLQPTISESIKHLFSNLERKHGEIFVFKALGYLTTARHGLSESELEDVLSCDDVVLNDIYQYWTPPVRRLPPLLFVRLKMDIDEYLVERGVDGSRVLYWYHSQFLSVARDRYCEANTRRQLHESLAEYFSGKWADKKEKVYFGKNGEEHRADRLVKSQPIILGDTYNLRKINNLPYHWANANRAQELKRECLINFTFLQAKLNATSIGNILNDYQLAMSIFPDDQAIHLVAKVMQLSQAGLRADPQQLPTQLLDRCGDEQKVEIVNLLKDCVGVPGYTLLADKQLLTKADEQIPAVFTHDSTITAMDITVNGRILVTCDETHTIKFWSLREKSFIKGFTDIVKDISNVHFVSNDHFVLVEHNKKSLLTTLDADGQIHGQIEVDFYCTLGGPGRSLLLTAKGYMFKVFDAEKLTFLREKKSPRSTPLGYDLTANEHKAVIGLGGRTKVKFSVIDLKTMVFTQQKELPIRSMRRNENNDDNDDNVSSMHLTPSGRYLVVTIEGDSGFIVYKMPLLKELYRIPGNQDDSRWDFHFGATGHSLYFLSLAEFSLYQIQTLDVRTGDLNTVHYTTASRVRTHRGNVMVTGGFDGVVKMWDLAGLKINNQSAVEEKGFRIENLRQLHDSRYAISLSSLEKKGLQLLQVYDIAEKKVVRQAFVGKEDTLIECCLDHHAVMETKDKNIRKLKMVNLDTMTVTFVFQGRLNNRISGVHVLHDRNEVLALSQGRRSLKTYDLNNGKTKAILKPPEDIDWAQFTQMICYSDNIVVASMTSTGIVVFDLVTSSMKCIYTSELEISDEDATAGSWTRISKGAKFIAIRCERKLPALLKESGLEMTAYLIHIWDIENWKYNGYIFEEPMHYEIMSRLDEKAEFFSDFLFLDDLRIATIFDQHKGEILIWDSNKNECLERLSSSITPDADLFTNDVSPYLLVYNLANLEIWEKSNLKCLASMTTDYDVHFSELAKDGLSVLGCKEVPVEIIHWTLQKGGNPVYDMSKKPILFEGVRNDLKLNLSVDDDGDSVASDIDFDIDDSSDDDKDTDVDEENLDEVDDLFNRSSNTPLTDDAKLKAMRTVSGRNVNENRVLHLTDDDKEEKLYNFQNKVLSEEAFKETSTAVKQKGDSNSVDDGNDKKQTMENEKDGKRKLRQSSSSPVPSLETYDYGDASDTSDF
ncbi:NACHT and WD repeat domain-containing protein 2-like [Pecten maximus]|uniref:NACHT and WD repeat domain-containing protein 2-like n=1 Tax=Pecten maximus TaxID=6579 RepID=UPI0014580962|nr:NACHT and WD repeat domain-containing protein 2-like [Pecten maximus]